MTRRTVLIAVLLTVLAITPAIPVWAGGPLRCIGTPDPPVKACELYPDINAAMAEAGPSDEIRVYGKVPVSAIQHLDKGRTLKGMSVGGVRGTLDGSQSDVFIVLNVLKSGLKIENLDILVPADLASIGVMFNQIGQVSTNGLSVIGPKGGQAYGAVINQGVGRVTIYGSSSLSKFSGLDTGLIIRHPMGRPSPNGVDFEDVRVGIDAAVVAKGQYFHSHITCGRPDSIGVSSAVESVDHNGLTITNCSVGIQIAPLGDLRGRGNEWDRIAMVIKPCTDPAGCVAVRAVQLDGTVKDDYRADPNCADAWGQSTTIDGVPIQKFNSGPCFVEATKAAMKSMVKVPKPATLAKPATLVKPIK